MSKNILRRQTYVLPLGRGTRRGLVPFSWAHRRLWRYVWLPLLAILAACNSPERAISLTASAKEKLLVQEYADTTVFVSTEGDDAWSGKLCCPNADSTDGPLATLSRARVALRAFETDVPRRIIVREGEYYDVAFELYARDSNLTLQAAPSEEVILYGGHRVTDWVREEDGQFWSAALSGVREGKWTPRLLQVDGQVRPRARLPAEGTFTHESVFDVRWMSASLGGWERKPTPQELTTLKYRPGDLGPWLEVRNAELTIYHAWDDSTVGLRSIDPERRIVTFSNPAGHPPGAFASWNQHAKTYVVWNVRQGMARPGQWYVDKVNGRVVYWPLPGEDMAQVRAIVPENEWIIRLSGAGGGAIRNLTIEGLTLSGTTTPLTAGGFGAEQLSGALTGDVTLIDCRFEDLDIRNVAGHGIKLRNQYNRNVTSRGATVEHTGAGGIYVTGNESLISQNLVAHVGLMYPAAMGIFGGGDRNVISHNDVHDTSYTGINGGGGTGNRIEYNDIARVMQVLNDGAAIYSIFARDLVVHGNVARDIGNSSDGAHAYYIDELSENCVVSGNLAVGVASPVQNHMASSNRIEDNVFINDGDVALRFVRSTGYTLSRNVVYATGQIVFHHIDAVETFDRNIFYSGLGQVEARQYHPDTYRLLAIDRLPASEDTLQVDPAFVDLLGGDFHFQDHSPALRLGIESIDVSQAGRSN